MTAQYISGSNGFIPSFEATGHLTVAYSRNVKDFPLNKYITITPVKQTSGYYLTITPEVAARVVNTDILREFIWTDGADRPKGVWNTESFEWKQYLTARYDYPFMVGYKAEKQADWKILALHADFVATQAMTARTTQVHNILLTTGNYATGHSDTAANWGGGFLNAGTPTSPNLKKALNAMAKVIVKDTNGAVKPARDCMVILSVDAADAIGRSQEVHTYLKESMFALAQVRGDKESQNGQWGLPDQLYGYPIVVEDTVRVSSKKGATRSADFNWTSGSVVMATRKGGLTSPAGGPSFSSVHLFSYEEMTVEQQDDNRNRRLEGHVVEDYDVRLVAPAATVISTTSIN